MDGMRLLLQVRMAELDVMIRQAVLDGVASLVAATMIVAAWVTWQHRDREKVSK